LIKRIEIYLVAQPAKTNSEAEELQPAQYPQTMIVKENEITGSGNQAYGIIKTAIS